MNVSRIALLGVVLTAGVASATHPIDPTSLAQTYNTATLAAGATVPPGATVAISAFCSASTSGGSYTMQFEVRELAQAFTGTATHTSAAFSTTGVQVSVNVTLTTGTYKWRARLSAPGGLSAWVNFNAGQAAFIVSGASLSPTSLAFGDVKVGSTAAETITFTNGGTTAITFNSATITGPFAIASAPAAGTSIAANGGTAVFGITATPTATGSATGTLTINTDAVNSPHTAPLSVTGGVPSIAISPSPVNFGDSGINATPGEQTVTVTNSSKVPLAISTTSATAPFGVSGLAGSTIAAGGNKTFTVTFAPTAQGAQSGTLTITSDAPTSPTAVNLSGTGVEPLLTLSTKTVSFPDTTVGATATSMTITASNTGTGTLKIAVPTINGAFTTTLGQTNIPQGGSSTFTISFAPNAPGAITGSVILSSDDANGPQTITLSGTARAPSLAASPTSASFGTVAIGASQTTTLTLTNSGDAALAVSAVSFSGVAASEYSLVAAPSAPFSIPANGGTQQLTVKFSPTDVGPRAAALTLTSNNYPAGPFTVPLSGAGNGPLISVNQTSMAFGAQNIGGTTPGTVVVFNSGNQPLSVNSVIFSGAAATDFSSTTVTPVTVAAGGSVALNLVFKPSQAGMRSAVATIGSDDALQPGVQVTLSGTGIAPNIAATPLSLNFGQIRVGQNNVLTVTVHNTGTGPLTIGGLMFTGSDAPRFGVSGISTPYTIAAGGAPAQFQVTFSPSSVGVANASLVIASDDPDTGSLQLPATGEGIAPGISVSTGSLQFGGQFVNRPSQPRTFEITNTGSASMQVFALSITGSASTAFKVTQPPTPFTVQPGAKQTVAVTLTPNMTGEQSARLFIQNDAPNGAQAHVDLVGMALSSVFAVSPSTIDFGTVKMGNVSEQFEVTLQNNSSDVLALSPAVVIGANQGEFAVEFMATQVEPQASVTAKLRYAPKMAGEHLAELELASSDPFLPKALVQLTGTSVSRILEASPSSFDFGQVPNGNTVQHLFSISNKTSKTVVITNVNTTSPEFTIESSGIGPVEPGKALVLPVNFTPNAEHLAIGTLNITIEGAAPGSTELSIAVSGTGTKAVETKAGCTSAGDVMGLWSVLALAGTALLRRRRVTS